MSTLGAPLTEFVLETVLRDGLGDIASNPALFDEIFSNFTKTYFNNQYGQDRIDQFKDYISRKQIKLVQSWAMIPARMPSISIQLEAAQETPEMQQLGNEFPDEDISKTPDVIVSGIDPDTYDSTTGKLTIANPGSVDLSSICPGMVFVDASSNEFTIQSGNSNQSGDKFINIGKNENPDLNSGASIVSSVDFTRTKKRMIRTVETLVIGCHSTNDVHLSKFLYYIVLYILKSRQEQLEQRGIHLDRTSARVFNREDEYKGENLFSRMIEFNCYTQFVWNDGEANLVDCFDLNLKAPAPNPDSSNAQKINTSDN